jgi:hypothetical protein
MGANLQASSGETGTASLDTLTVQCWTRSLGKHWKREGLVEALQQDLDEWPDL